MGRKTPSTEIPSGVEPDGPYVLEVTHLSVSFDETTILADLSFSIGRGDAVAVIGPNGSGKTVLFRALIGAVPYKGSIRWATGTRLGYVPQKLDLERDLPITGGDLLRARFKILHAPREEALRAIERVDLRPDMLRQPIGSMSGGQFQRLLVAFALIGKPNVLLLDEPAAAVDAPGQQALNEALHRLREEQGVTTLLISHDLSVVNRYASKVLCLARKHVYMGAPELVLTPERLSQLYGTPITFHLHEGHGR